MLINKPQVVHMRVYILKNKLSYDKAFRLKSISDHLTSGDNFMRKLDRPKVLGFKVGRSLTSTFLVETHSIALSLSGAAQKGGRGS